MTETADEKKAWLTDYFMSIGITVNQDKKNAADEIQKSHPLLYDQVLKGLMQEHLFDVPKDGGVPLAKFFGLGAMLIATQTAQNSSKDLLEFFWQGMLKFKTYDECRALLKKCGPVSPSFTVPLDKFLLVDGLNFDQVSEEKRAPALTTKKKI